jgi:UDP-N-acetylglucosamine--N-acetylmuramyl-(pentapeptide) pyrophosphoryl-undecaprenol N-acetylglucosamine transferase
MDLAYATADVVISRAGAISVSELCIVAKPTILVPSPNVAEDHQTKNAMALVDAQAAKLVRDDEARNTLVQTSIELISSITEQEKLSTEIKKFGKANATHEIVDWCESIAIKKWK